jgi:hypothetical protein
MTTLLTFLGTVLLVGAPIGVYAALAGRFPKFRTFSGPFLATYTSLLLVAAQVATHQYVAALCFGCGAVVLNALVFRAALRR